MAWSSQQFFSPFIFLSNKRVFMVFNISERMDELDRSLIYPPTVHIDSNLQESFESVIQDLKAIGSLAT